MNNEFLIKYLITLVILYISEVSSGCVDLDSVTQDGKRMISNVFKMVESVSLYTCVSHCLTVSTCKSVSYQRETRTCHLASQDSAGDPGDVHTDPEFFLTDISLWPGSMAGTCEGKACAIGTRCVVDRFHNSSCVSDEHTGCGPVPDLDHATKSSTGRYEGAVTQYTCLSDFLFCGTSSTHTCSSLGNWEGLSGACNRAVWYNPNITFVEGMPCPMTEGFKVRFEGRPILHRRVVMTIQTTNFVIQADARFDYFGIQDTFLLNKQVNGVWKTDLEVPMMFDVGETFICELVRQNGAYELYINRTYTGHSEDGTPNLHPDTIEVSYDVQMDKITFSHA